MRIENASSIHCFLAGLILALTLGLCGASVSAGEDGVETSYRTGFGARAIAMGGAFSSLSDDPSSSFYNPAGLGSIDKVWLSSDLSVFSRYTYSGYGILAGRIPGTKTVLAFAVQHVQVRKNVAEVGPQISVYDDSKTQFQGSIGHEFPVGIALGFTLKLNRRQVEGDSDYGSTVDFGARYPIDDHWSIGGAACDIISFKDIESDRNSASPKARVAVGASYANVAVTERLGLVISADLLMVDDRTEDDVKMLFGAEADYGLLGDLDALLRCGYNGDGLTAGAGFGMDWWRFDYALAKNADDMGFDNYSHSISLSLQPLKLIPKTGPNPDSVLADYRRERYSDLIGNGRVYMGTREFRRAQQAFDQAIVFAEPGRSGEAVNGSKAASDSLEAEAALDINVTFEAELARLRRELNAEFRDREDSLSKDRANELDSLQIELDQALELAGEQIEGYFNTADDIFRDRQYAAAEQILDRIDQNIKAYVEVVPASREKMQEVSWNIQELRSTIQNRRSIDRDMTVLAAVRAEQMDSLVAAIEHYDRALTLDSGYQAALEGRRRVNQRIANLVAQWRAEQSDGDSNTPQTDAAIQLLYQEGLNYYRNGEYQKAIDTWEKVLRADPAHPSVTEDIATARSRLESEQ